MAMYQIGFVGGGSIADRHASTVLDLGHTISAVADLDPEVQDEFARQYDVDAQYEDYQRMIAEADLDVVVVAVPNAIHADCAIAALEANTHVYVEKPLADTLPAAERIAEAEAESEAELIVGFKKPFEANVQAVCNCLDDDEFGSLYEVNVEWVRHRGIPQIGS